MSFSYSSNEVGRDCQVSILTLDFISDNQEFHCLVRAKIFRSKVLYFLTLLNADMEEIFPEPYVITERERILYIEAPIKTGANIDLKFAVSVALRNFLSQNSTSDEAKTRYIA